jgi:TolA-binding protein
MSRLSVLLLILVVLLGVGGAMEYQRRQQRAERQRADQVRLQEERRAALERERIEREARIERLEQQGRQRRAEAQATPSAIEREVAMRHLGRVIEPLQAHAKRFSDALQLAAATPRGALAGPVAQLQVIARETAATPISGGCMEAPKRYLVAGMDDAVQGFLAFMRDEDKDAYLARARRQMEQWNTGAEACMQAAMRGS